MQNDIDASVRVIDFVMEAFNFFKCNTKETLMYSKIIHFVSYAGLRKARARCIAFERTLISFRIVFARCLV